MIKVSIIIPLHNAEAYITEALQSCFQQTHKDIEVIVVENASTDKSYEVVANIKESSLQLYHIDTPNAGAARNFGYQKATGDYILFLDADDLLAHNKIELQLKALAEKPKGWIASCAWAKFDKEIEGSNIEIQNVWKVEDPVRWCMKSWTGGGMMTLGSWLIPKDLIKNSGLWDERLSLHDDGEFICRVLLASKGNLFVPDTMVYYRQVSDSLSKQNISMKAAQSALRVCKSYEESILKIKDDPKIKNALAYSYRNFIYEFHPNYVHLLKEAEQHIKNLKLRNIPLVGGRKFKQLARIIGFNNALKLRNMIQKLVS
jgi:glycosyltransferase involved in cell wall biosynthesis